MLHGVHTLRCLDADLLEALSLFHWPHDCLHKLLNLFVQPAHVGVLLCRLLVHLHCLDSAVVLRGQCIEDEIRIFVHTNEVTRLELLVVDESDEWEEDRLSGGGLDDGALANTGGVQIDIGAFLRCLLLNIQVQNLHHVSDEVW